MREYSLFHLHSLHICRVAIQLSSTFVHDMKAVHFALNVWLKQTFYNKGLYCQFLDFTFQFLYCLFQYGQITPQLAFKVLLQFDKSINAALNSKVKARVTFKASKLNTYRFCDNVWTLMLNDVEFREVHEFAKVDKVKIVACDGKSE